MNCMSNDEYGIMIFINFCLFVNHASKTHLPQSYYTRESQYETGEDFRLFQCPVLQVCFNSAYSTASNPTPPINYCSTMDFVQCEESTSANSYFVGHE
jgi:hypothetical protein